MVKRIFYLDVTSPSSESSILSRISRRIYHLQAYMHALRDSDTLEIGKADPDVTAVGVDILVLEMNRHAQGVEAVTSSEAPFAKEPLRRRQPLGSPRRRPSIPVAQHKRLEAPFGLRTSVAVLATSLLNKRGEIGPAVGLGPVVRVLISHHIVTRITSHVGCPAG
jgi:hypothetical protein